MSSETNMQPELTPRVQRKPHLANTTSEEMPLLRRDSEPPAKPLAGQAGDGVSGAASIPHAGSGKETTDGQPAEIQDTLERVIPPRTIKWLREILAVSFLAILLVGIMLGFVMSLWNHFAPAHLDFSNETLHAVFKASEMARGIAIAQPITEKESDSDKQAWPKPNRTQI